MVAEITHFNTHCGGSQAFAIVQELIKKVEDSSVSARITEELHKSKMGADGLE